MSSLSPEENRPSLIQLYSQLNADDVNSCYGIKYLFYIKKNILSSTILAFKSHEMSNDIIFASERAKVSNDIRNQITVDFGPHREITFYN